MIKSTKLRESKSVYRKVLIKVDRSSSQALRWSLLQLNSMMDLGDDMPSDEKAELIKCVAVAVPVVVILIMSILIIAGGA